MGKSAAAPSQLIGAMAPISHLVVGGVPTALVSRADICDVVVGDAKARAESEIAVVTRLMFSVNGQALSLAASDQAYREALLQADMIHADGQAIVMAGNLLGGAQIPERSATTDLIHDISKVAVENGLSFYLLGATEEINRRCAEELQVLYPGMEIVGRRNGYFDKSEEYQICEGIRASGADVLWVGLGKPKEQLFCVRNRERLGVSWAITCGGCFNFITGDYRRAPQWMQHIGLEWVFRMLTNPKKLFWRYLTTNLHAIYLMLTRTRRVDRPRSVEAKEARRS